MFANVTLFTKLMKTVAVFPLVHMASLSKINIVKLKGLLLGIDYVCGYVALVRRTESGYSTHLL